MPTKSMKLKAGLARGDKARTKRLDRVRKNKTNPFDPDTNVKFPSLEGL